MSAGKGDTPRPLSIAHEEFAARWNRIFREKICTVCGEHYTETEAPAGFDVCEMCWDLQVTGEAGEDYSWALPRQSRCNNCRQVADVYGPDGFCERCNREGV